MLLESAAAILVYLAVVLLAKNVLIAVIAMVAVLFILRLTRPKPQ